MAVNPDMKVKIGVEDSLLSYLRDAQAQVKQFDNTVKKSGSVVQAYGAQHSDLAKRFKFFKGAAQQLGFQIGDYAVQVANGTSKMQAFGQQGAQMLGVFGPIGAILGAGVAVFSAIAVAAEKSAAGTKKAKDEFVDMAEKLSTFKQLEADVRSFGAVTVQQMALATAEVRGLISALKEAEATKLLNSMSAQFSGVLGELTSFQDELSRQIKRSKSMKVRMNLDVYAGDDDAQRQFKEAFDEAQAAIAKIGASSSDISGLFNQIASLSKEMDPDKLVIGLAQVRADAEAIGGEVGRSVVKAVDAAATSAGVLPYVISAAKEQSKGAAREMAYTDQILRQVGINASNAAVTFRRMKKAADLRRETEQTNVSLNYTDQILRGARSTASSMAVKFREMVKATQDQAAAEERRRQAIFASAGAARQLAAALRSADQATMTDKQRAAVLKAQIAAAEAGTSVAAAAASTETVQRLSAAGASLDMIVRKAQEAGQSAAEVEALEKAFQKLQAGAEKAGGAGAKAVKKIREELTETQQAMNSISETMKSAMTDAFMSIVDGTKSAKEAFKTMARSIIAKLYEVLVVQRMVGSFDAAKGTGTGLVGALMGAFTGARASGGQVTANKAYLVGEKGPEMLVPNRNAHIIPNGKAGSGGVTVVQNNTFGSGVTRAEVSAMLPKIVETTKAAVFDAQRRSATGMGY